MVALARRPDDVGSAGNGDLDDHQPDPAGRGVHENGLAGADAGRGERMDRGGAGQHQPPGRLPAHRRRLRNDRRRRITSSSAYPPSTPIGDHLVPHGDRPGRTDRLAADLRHHAGGLEPQAHRQAGAVPIEPL